MSVEFYRESPGKFDSRTLSRKTLIGGLGVCNCLLSDGRVPHNRVCKLNGHPPYRVVVHSKWSWGMTTGMTTLWRVAPPQNGTLRPNIVWHAAR